MNGNKTNKRTTNEQVQNHDPGISPGITNYKTMSMQCLHCAKSNPRITPQLYVQDQLYSQIIDVKNVLTVLECVQAWRLPPWYNLQASSTARTTCNLWSACGRIVSYSRNVFTFWHITWLRDWLGRRWCTSCWGSHHWLLEFIFLERETEKGTSINY